MVKKTYSFKTSDEKIIAHLDTIENKSEYLEKLLLQFVTGVLDVSSISKLDLAKIKKLEADARLANARAVYFETFQREPTHAANRAMIAGNNQTATPQTAAQLTKNYSVFQHVEKIFHNDINQVVVICKYCRADFIDEVNEKAIQEFKDHMELHHVEVLLR